MRESERDSVCVCMSVPARDCVCVKERKCEWIKECVSVCECIRECACEGVYICDCRSVSLSVYVYKCVRDCEKMCLLRKCWRTENV